MSAHKHTQGPWRAVVRNNNEMMTTFHGVLIGEVVIDTPTGSQQADARLIAAAPTYHQGADAFLAYVAAAEVGDDVAAMRHFDDAKRLLSEAHANAAGNGGEARHG